MVPKKRSKMVARKKKDPLAGMRKRDLVRHPRVQGCLRSAMYETARDVIEFYDHIRVLEDLRGKGQLAEGELQKHSSYERARELAGKYADLDVPDFGAELVGLE